MDLAPENLIPIATRQDYRITPTIPVLSRMSEYELKRVQDFKVENQFGSIQWMGKTDVSGLNIDELVTITKKQAEVYPIEIEERGLKPPVGQKLNKPSIITLDHNTLKDNETMDDFQKRQQRKLDKIGATFLSCNNT